VLKQVVLFVLDSDRRYKYCDNHRGQSSRGKREWLRIKSDPKKLERYRRERAKWRRKNRQKSRDYINELNRQVKIRVLSFYGKNKKLACCWRRCAVHDVDMLTLDHIENGGTIHRLSGFGGGIVGYWKLERTGYPSGFQTLCMNHQLKKEIIRKKRNRKRE
jgi:hypothetical protein